MKIGLIIYGSLDTISGGYLYDRKVVEYLRAKGDTVEIIASPWRGYLRHILDNFSNSYQRKIKSLDVDVLLQDELNHPSLFLLNHRLGPLPPRISIVHHLLISESRPSWLNRLFGVVERSYLHSVDGFIFNSQTTQTSVQEQLSANAANLKNSIIAYPGADQFKPDMTTEEVTARALEPGPLRLIFLGNLIPRKGLHILLQAISYLPSGTCKLVVVGNPDYHPNYTRYVMAQAASLNLGSSVLFMDYLEDADLAAQLRRSQVLAVPSSYEGYGIAYLEGMSFGLPCLATTSGAAGEIITSGRDGYLVPPEDAEELAKVIASLASDRQNLLKMSLSALHRFGTQPSWELTGQKIRKYLQSIVQSG